MASSIEEVDALATGGAGLRGLNIFTKDLTALTTGFFTTGFFGAALAFGAGLATMKSSSESSSSKSESHSLVFFLALIVFFLAAVAFLALRAVFFFWACTSLFNSAALSTSRSLRASSIASKSESQMDSGDVAWSASTSSAFSAFWRRSSSARSNVRLQTEMMISMREKRCEMYSKINACIIIA